MQRIAARDATRPLKPCVGAGPLNLAVHVTYDHPHSYYSGIPDLVEDLIPVFNLEMRELVDVGARVLQLEDLGAWMPLIPAYGVDSDFVVDVINRTIEGVEAKIAWHFCLGNERQRNVSVWGGMLDRVLPPLYESNVDQFVLDFALRDMSDIGILSTLPPDKEVAAGVVDVRSLQIETAGQIADRMRKVLAVVPADRVWFTTDCGLRNLPRFVAFEKLKSMHAAAETVRAEWSDRSAVLAAVYHGRGDVRIEQAPDPGPLGSAELRLRVHCASLCGTDASEFRHGPALIPMDARHSGSGHLGPNNHRARIRRRDRGRRRGRRARRLGRRRRIVRGRSVVQACVGGAERQNQPVRPLLHPRAQHTWRDGRTHQRPREDLQAGPSIVLRRCGGHGTAPRGRFARGQSRRGGGRTRSWSLSVWVASGFLRSPDW